MGNCLCHRNTNIRSQYDLPSETNASPVRNSTASIRKSFRRQLGHLNILRKSSGASQNDDSNDERDRDRGIEMEISCPVVAVATSQPTTATATTQSSIPKKRAKPQRPRSAQKQKSQSKGKNKPLQRTLHRSSTKNQIENTWTTQVLTEKRAEFWDTAPSYDGREEIWLALKAAIDNITQNPPNYDLAQVIIDSAGVMLPYGSFDCCYDELGTMYQIPSWVVAAPKMAAAARRSQRKSTSISRHLQETDSSSITRFDNFRNSVRSALSLSKSQNQHSSKLDKFNRGSSANQTKILKTYKFRLMNYSATISDLVLEDIDQNTSILQCKRLLYIKIIDREHESDDTGRHEDGPDPLGSNNDNNNNNNNNDDNNTSQPIQKEEKGINHQPDSFSSTDCVASEPIQLTNTIANNEDDHREIPSEIQVSSSDQIELVKLQLKSSKECLNNLELDKTSETVHATETVQNHTSLTSNRTEQINLESEILIKEQVKKMTWFCAGRVLKNENKLRSCKIQDGFIVQVHMRS